MLVQAINTTSATAAIRTRSGFEHCARSRESQVAAGFLSENLGLQVETYEESSVRYLLRLTREHLALVAVSLAFGAALVAPRIAQVLLIGAAAGVLAASAVGLVVWADGRDSPGKTDRPVRHRGRRARRLFTPTRSRQTDLPGEVPR